MPEVGVKPDGSYTRARYDLMRRNQATLKNVYALAENQTLNVLSAGVELDQQVYGGFLRKVLPSILDDWGNVSAVAAMEHYEAARQAWLNTTDVFTFANDTFLDRARWVDGKGVIVLKPGESVTLEATRKQFADLLGDSTRRADNYAAKVLEGKLYKAKLPAFDPEAMSDPIVNYAMKTWANQGPAAANTAAANALTRQIGAYNRDTMLFNAGLDSSVAGVQRVAHPGACAWCQTLAVGGVGRYGKQVLDFAMKFHDKCKCGIEPLYAGDKPLRPDYYDDMEKQISKAYAGEFDEDTLGSLADEAKTNASMRRLVQKVRAVKREDGN